MGTCFEYYAMSLGARSQSAKTYLERRMDEYKEEEDLDKIVMHGLYALRETLQQGKEVRSAMDNAVLAVLTSVSSFTPTARASQRISRRRRPRRRRGCRSWHQGGEVPPRRGQGASVVPGQDGEEEECKQRQCARDGSGSHGGYGCPFRRRDGRGG